MSIQKLFGAALMVAGVVAAASYQVPAAGAADGEADGVFGGACYTYSAGSCGTAGQGGTHFPTCQRYGCSGTSGFVVGTANPNLMPTSGVSCGGSCGVITTSVAPCATTAVNDAN